jgi:hypothetical protein
MLAGCSLHRIIRDGKFEAKGLVSDGEQLESKFCFFIRAFQWARLFTLQHICRLNLFGRRKEERRGDKNQLLCYPKKEQKPRRKEREEKKKSSKIVHFLPLPLSPSLWKRGYLTGSPSSSTS